MTMTRTCMLGLLALTATCAAAGTPEIVGGTPAPEGRYPWMVPVLLADEPNNFLAQFCGGTLVSPTKVLTAAHCVGPQFDILVGTQDLTNGQGRRIRVISATPHPQYNRSQFDYDVAVLTLAEPVTDVTPVRFISTLAEEAQYMPTRAKLTVMGYGHTGQSGATSNILREVKVPVVSTKVCNRFPAYPFEIGETEFCAGFKDGGKDSCQGDSGGPIIRRGKTAKDDIQVGISSWGQGCAQPNKPGVYDRLGVTGSWVQQQIAMP